MFKNNIHVSPNGQCLGGRGWKAFLYENTVLRLWPELVFPVKKYQDYCDKQWHFLFSSGFCRPYERYQADSMVVL